jgi:hypothetical protein
MTGFIAEKVIDALDAKGERLQFRLGIEAPRQIDDVSWGCGLLMEGVGRQPYHRVVGYDAWQALTLAVRLVEQLLTYFVEDGGSLFWEGSENPMAISDVVPHATKTGSGQ